MSEGRYLDGQRTTTLEEEREVTKEAAMAAVGDVEAQQEFNLQVDETALEKAGEEIHDPYLVEWDGLDDPGNPLNFKMRRKVGFMAMIAAICFLTYLLFRDGLKAKTYCVSNVFTSNSRCHGRIWRDI
jgi:hypothetical protein